jgi:CD36 family
MCGRNKPAPACCGPLCWHRRAGASIEDAWRCRISFSMLLVGLFCAGLGLFLHLFIDATFDKTLESQVVCTERDCDVGGKMQWTSFIEEPFPGSPKPFQAFHFFNLTNADDVTMRGKKPIYKEIGPFVYELNRKKVSILPVLPLCFA